MARAAAGATVASSLLETFHEREQWWSRKEEFLNRMHAQTLEHTRAASAALKANELVKQKELIRNRIGEDLELALVQRDGELQRAKREVEELRGIKGRRDEDLIHMTQQFAQELASVESEHDRAMELEEEKFHMDTEEQERKFHLGEYVEVSVLKPVEAELQQLHEDIEETTRLQTDAACRAEEEECKFVAVLLDAAEAKEELRVAEAQVSRLKMERIRRESDQYTQLHAQTIEVEDKIGKMLEEAKHMANLTGLLCTRQTAAMHKLADENMKLLKVLAGLPTLRKVLNDQMRSLGANSGQHATSSVPSPGESANLAKFECSPQKRHQVECGASSRSGDEISVIRESQTSTMSSTPRRIATEDVFSLGIGSGVGITSKPHGCTKDVGKVAKNGRPKCLGCSLATTSKALVRPDGFSAAEKTYCARKEGRNQGLYSKCGVGDILDVPCAVQARVSMDKGSLLDELPVSTGDSSLSLPGPHCARQQDHLQCCMDTPRSQAGSTIENCTAAPPNGTVYSPSEEVNAGAHNGELAVTCFRNQSPYGVRKVTRLRLKSNVAHDAACRKVTPAYAEVGAALSSSKTLGLEHRQHLRIKEKSPSAKDNSEALPKSMHSGIDALGLSTAWQTLNI